MEIQTSQGNIRNRGEQEAAGDCTTGRSVKTFQLGDVNSHKKKHPGET